MRQELIRKVVLGNHSLIGTKCPMFRDGSAKEEAILKIAGMHTDKL